MVTFGGYDLENYSKGPINWHNIEKNSYHWELKMEKMEYNLIY